MSLPWSKGKLAFSAKATSGGAKAVNAATRASLVLLGSLVALASLWWGHQGVRSDLESRVIQELSAGRVVAVEGTVKRIYRNREGMLLVDLGTDAPVIFMPSGGKLPTEPRLGERLQVLAVRSDGPQGSALYPVSQDHIRPQGRSEYPLVTISQARRMAKGSRIQLHVRGTSATTQTSRAGKTHLHVEVKDATGQAPGIMWEGSYSAREVDLFRSGRPLVVYAEVDFFQSNLSLVIIGAKEERP